MTKEILVSQDRLKVDSWYTMGMGHKFCEDYAFHKKIYSREGDRVNENALILLSDGCSGSDNTDVGARMMVHSAEILFTDAIEKGNFDDLEPFYRDAARRTLLHLEALGLPEDAADASLVSLIATDGYWLAGLYGDGAVVTKGKNGEIQIFTIQYSQNYPVYPIYQVVEGRYELLQELVPHNQKQVWISTYNPDGTFEEKGYVTEEFLTEFGGNTKDYEFVAIFTDGVDSFTKPDPMRPTKRKYRKHQHLATFIPELTKFNNLKGAFVERKMRSFVERKAELGWEHYDDFTMGVIHFGHQGKRS